MPRLTPRPGHWSSVLRRLLKLVPPLRGRFRSHPSDWAPRIETGQMLCGPFRVLAIPCRKPQELKIPLLLAQSCRVTRRKQPSLPALLYATRHLFGRLPRDYLDAIRNDHGRNSRAKHVWRPCSSPKPDAGRPAGTLGGEQISNRQAAADAVSPQHNDRQQPRGHPNASGSRSLLGRS